MTRSKTRRGALTKGRTGQALARRRRVVLQLEALEERMVPTILFQPQFGAEVRLTTNDYGQPYWNGPVLSSTPIHFIFEGNYWANPTGVTAQDVIFRALGVVNSQYLSGLVQYGSDGHAFLYSAVYDNSMPEMARIDGSMMFYDSDLETTAQQFMTEAPQPASARGLYFVITAPGAVSMDSPEAGGYHGALYVGSLHESIPYGWLGISSGTKDSELDSLSDIFSHELVEAMSDPYPPTHPDAVPGVTVYHGAQWQDSSGLFYDEIADFEPDGGRYTYRLSTGALVQAYWSAQDQAYIIPDGTTQAFTLTPKWNGAAPDGFNGTYTLTINGDQAWYKNDTASIEMITSGAQLGGLRVTLNGSVAIFDAGLIQEIDVHTGLGDDTVNVESIPYSVSLLQVDLGTGHDVINLSPVARQMDNLNGSAIQIQGGSDSSLVVYDSATVNLGAETHQVQYAISETALTRTDLVMGARGEEILSTDVQLLGIGNIVVYGSTTPAMFEIYAADLSFPVSLYGNSGQDALLFDDSLNANNAGTVYTIASDSLTRVGTDLDSGRYYPTYLTQTAEVHFQSIQTIIIDGGSSGNSFDVQGVALGTTLSLFTGAGINRIQVGDDLTSMDSILGTLSIDGNGSDSLILDDRAVQSSDWFWNQVAYAINYFSVTRTNTQTVDLKDPFGEELMTSTKSATITYLNVASLTIEGGSSGNTFDVQSTPAGTGLTLLTGTGANVVTIGDSVAGLELLGGPVHVVGEGGINQLIVIDSAALPDGITAANSDFTITDQSISHSVDLTGTDRQGDEFTRTATAFISYSDVAFLTIYGDALDNTFDIQATPVGSFVTLITGIGTNSIHVVLSGLGGMLQVVADPAGTTLVTLDDSTSATPMEYDLAATTVGWEPLGLDTAAAQFSFANLAGLTLLGGSGGNTIRVLDLPAAPFALDGGLGDNTLDYSSFVGDIVVDLPLGSATGFSAVAEIQNVVGSMGNDILVGDGNSNVLVGGAGRNLIIGGIGAQLLVGGGADNILITGQTIYDTNLTALEAIMQEWGRTDLSYDERVAELSDPAFEYALTTDTVFSDGGIATVLGGGGGEDWILS
jgi:hypothetical protein